MKITSSFLSSVRRDLVAPIRYSYKDQKMPSQIVAAAVIYAKDMLRISRFYEAIAGLVVVEAGAEHIVLEGGGFQLSVVAIPANIAATVKVSDPPARREGSSIKLVHFIPSIAAVRKRTAELGGQLNSAGREWEFQGVQVCDGHDPEGNVFQLRENSLVDSTVECNS